MHDFKNKCKVLNVKLVYAIWVIFGFMELYLTLGLPSWVYFIQAYALLAEHLGIDTLGHGESL